jgi:hypothetical protein
MANQPDFVNTGALATVNVLSALAVIAAAGRLTFAGDLIGRRKVGGLAPRGRSTHVEGWAIIDQATTTSRNGKIRSDQGFLSTLPSKGSGRRGVEQLGSSLGS